MKEDTITEDDEGDLSDIKPDYFWVKLGEGSCHAKLAIDKKRLYVGWDCVDLEDIQSKDRPKVEQAIKDYRGGKKKHLGPPKVKCSYDFVNRRLMISG